MTTSPNDHRRWLRFSLRTFLAVTLLLSVVLGLYGRAWWKAYRDSQPPTLSELAQIAKRHGIPMPPQGAKLVLVRSGTHYVNRQVWPRYSPAFLLEEHDDGSVVVLCGAEKFPRSGGEDLFANKHEAPLWQEFASSVPLVPTTPCFIEWSDADVLLCAIQLADRGDRERAEALLKQVAQSPSYQFPLPRDGSSNLPDLREFVRYCAFQRLRKSLRANPEQWPDKYRRLSALAEESLSLRRDGADLLSDLLAAIDAPPPRPGSVEALLVDWSRSAESWRRGLDAQEIVRRGFEAVPELIALADDRRFTVHERYHDDARDYCRLGELANDLLLIISGYGDSVRLSVAIGEEGRNWDAAAWQKWWEQAQLQGESSYCLRNLFYDSPDNFELRRGPATILAIKHPQVLLHMGEEYPKVAGQSVDIAQLGAGISRSQLSSREKTAILTELAETEKLQLRYRILRLLAGIDAKECAHLLTEFLENLPADLNGFDAGNRESIPTLVLELDDLALTRTYLRTARLSTKLRMEMISRLAYWHVRDEHFGTRVALLAAFIDDETPRDRSLKSERFFADDFAGISVGNFATMQLARILLTEAAPDATWTPDQWSTLREQVRQRLAQEELPELE
jgi:hypothetical protein